MSSAGVIQAHYEPYRSALKIYSFIDPSPIVFIFLLIVDYLIIYISIRLELATAYYSCFRVVLSWNY